MENLKECQKCKELRQEFLMGQKTNHATVEQWKKRFYDLEREMDAKWREKEETILRLKSKLRASCRKG